MNLYDNYFDLLHLKWQFNHIFTFVQQHKNIPQISHNSHFLWTIYLLTVNSY